MRPIKTDRNYVRYPLDELLGTQASVRILRLLAEEIKGPIGAPEAAEHTGMTEAGARRALQRLAKTGFIQRLGGARSQKFMLRESDQLATSLAALFRAEQDRYQDLISKLREIFGGLTEIQTAWIDEPPTKAGQPLSIGILADSKSLIYLRDQIRQRIITTEGEFDLTIEIHAFSRADVPDVNWDSTTLLAGFIIPEKDSPELGPSHNKRIERASRMSEAIASMIDSNPSLQQRAERHIDLLLKQDQGAASHDLREWHDVLTHYSSQRIKEFLVAKTPRAQRLRQSSPFFAVLTPDEREQILDAI